MAMDLTDKIYDYTPSLPEIEKYNLIVQLNKCAVSIPSNIAEGSGKRTPSHFAEFLSTALTSSYEMETQLLICERRRYGNSKELSDVIEFVIELQKKIFNFRESITNG